MKRNNPNKKIKESKADKVTKKSKTSPKKKATKKTLGKRLSLSLGPFGAFGWPMLLLTGPAGFTWHCCSLSRIVPQDL